MYYAVKNVYRYLECRMTDLIWFVRQTIHFFYWDVACTSVRIIDTHSSFVEEVRHLLNQLEKLDISSELALGMPENIFTP
jgi:hypothetical protein